MNASDAKSIVNWLKILTATVFISLAVMSFGSVLAWRVSTQNKTFLGNFSDYMRCLVVVDEPLYAQLGKEKYFDYCDVLLFRGTGEDPHKHQPVPTTSTTAGTTTSGSAIIGG